jgi:putative serine protease PepD
MVTDKEASMTSTPDHGTGAQDPDVQPQQPVDATQPLPTDETRPIPVPQTPAGEHQPAAPATAQPATAPTAAQPPVPPAPQHPYAAPGQPYVPPAQQYQQYQPYQPAQGQQAGGQPYAGQQHSGQQYPGQQYPAPAQHQPYPQHPGHAPFGYAQPAYAPPQPQAGEAHAGAPADPADPSAPAEGQPRKRRAWIPVTSAAAAAAVIAALAAAGITHGFDDHGTSSSAFGRPASIASIGQSKNDAVPVAGSTNENPNWESVANAVKNSVVAISVTTSSGGAEGSGVIVDDKGHVVTNNHVVSGAQGDVEVTLTDGRIFKATVVGTDATTDLAVVKLTNPPSDLKAASFGDSGKVIVGQPVMAVGNPLGLANTVTTGIVSAVDRPVTTTGENGGASTVTNAIQIDAAINPGNSGGPLFDATGKVIGINSSIATLSQSSGSIGLGFAIPVSLVQNIAQQLIDNGSAQHAYLGVSLKDGTATADGVTRRGATVVSVTDGSPAAKAGLQANDVIVAIDKQAVSGADSLTGYVRAEPSGTKVTLTIVRGGKSSDIDVTLAVRSESQTQQGQGQQGQGQQGQGQQGQQGQGQQGQGQQGQQGQGQQGTNPFSNGQGGLGNLSPDQLWQWFQQQQQGGGSGSGSGQG